MCVCVWCAVVFGVGVGVISLSSPCWLLLCGSLCRLCLRKKAFRLLPWLWYGLLSWFVVVVVVLLLLLSVVVVASLWSGLLCLALTVGRGVPDAKPLVTTRGAGKTRPILFYISCHGAQSSRLEKNFGLKRLCHVISCARDAMSRHVMPMHTTAKDGKNLRGDRPVQEGRGLRTTRASYAA